MKRLLAFIFLLASFVQAQKQYTVEGTMTPTLKSDWVILYKIEGAKQIFVKNTKIKKDSVTVDGEKKTIGHFEFLLPADAEVGAYRITYRLKEAGFVDFIFNKENISFTFHPDYPVQSVVFSESKENIFYKHYLNAIIVAQHKLDSLQITALQNQNLDLKKAYKTALEKINSTQKKYLNASNNMFVKPFIKASFRTNPPELQKTPQKYMSNMTNTFFKNIDFSDKTLLNSSFLIDKITDYVFHINYSDNKETQQKLYKKSINTVLSKITNMSFKKDVIGFLTVQFENSKNLELIDYMLEDQYKKLPENLQDKTFISIKKALFATEVGRIAPDFSWKEKGKTLKLSTLNDAKNYVLVFWSTGCSHCLRQIPKLFKLLKDKKEIKVIAFALEKDDFTWKNMKTTLPNWHHVLGLNKWQNKIARTYNINATPTYFVLDVNKKIIAKPEELKDLKAFLIKK